MGPSLTLVAHERCWYMASSRHRFRQVREREKEGNNIWCYRCITRYGISQSNGYQSWLERERERNNDLNTIDYVNYQEYDTSFVAMLWWRFKICEKEKYIFITFVKNEDKKWTTRIIHTQPHVPYWTRPCYLTTVILILVELLF